MLLHKSEDGNGMAVIELSYMGDLLATKQLLSHPILTMEFLVQDYMKTVA